MEKLEKIALLKKIKILNFLVVDDSPLNRKMLCKLLASEGHQYVQACDGLEAVERMKENMILENELALISKNNLIIEEDTDDDYNKNNNNKDDDRNSNDYEPESEYSSVKTYSYPDFSGIKSNILNYSNLNTIESDKKQTLYDAILMDFMMPNMDGPTATKIIRELGYKGLIIGVTGTYIRSYVSMHVCKYFNVYFFICLIFLII